MASRTGLVLLVALVAGCGGDPSPIVDAGVDGGTALDAPAAPDGGAADGPALDGGTCIDCDGGELDAGDVDGAVLDASEPDATDLDVGEPDGGDLDAAELDAAEPVDASVGCTYAIAPATRTITNACTASTGTLTVTVTSGCEWAAVVDVGGGPTGWLRVTSGGGPSTGTGAGQTVDYAVATNRHSDGRAGTITIVDASSTPTSAVATLSQAHGHTCP